MEIQAIYQHTIKYAALKHAEEGQTIPGTAIPYVVHLSNVCMEIIIAAGHTEDFDTELAVQVALLHDVLEDTQTSFEELAEAFDHDIANAVLALTKDSSLPKEERMGDSLSRIKAARREVWAVKLADRITNLQKPPAHWDNLKIEKYSAEAGLIASELKGANAYLENRIAEMIKVYGQYVHQE